MRILNESKRDDLLLPYVALLNEKGIKCNLGQLKKFLLGHLAERGGFRNLSLGSNFYLAGVARYYFNGDLTFNKDLAVFKENPMLSNDTWNEEICQRLNALILILRNSIVDSVGENYEQPEDFGTLPIAKLLRKYNKKINAELGIDDKKNAKAEPELDRTENVGNNYTFEIIYSYQQATKYYRPTDPGSWCITYGEGHYNNYIRMLNIHYVIFRQDGYENIPRQKGPNWTARKPQDEYGCSLIALLQSNVDGEPVYITSRWNHGKGYEDTLCEADHAFTKEEFFEKTGVTDADLQRIFQIWKKDKPKKGANSAAKISKEEKLKILRHLKYAQMCINGGENPDTALIKIPVTITEPELKKAYLEDSRKVVVGSGKPTKSIMQYRVEINGEYYYVLCDQGKILFDTVVPRVVFRPDGSYQQTYEYYPQEENGKYKNIIKIRIGENKYLLYNVRFHKFIEIDGVKVFKYCDNLKLSNWRDNSGVLFYEIKMSNRQVALVDYNTNIPLKLPNGRHWCESISCDYTSETWGREIRPRSISNENKHICMTYDSAANEVYLYNLQTKSFTQIDTSDIPQRTTECEHRVEPFSYLDKIFGEGAVCISVGARWYNMKIVLNNEGKRMSLGGFQYFTEFRHIVDDIFQIEAFDGPDKYNSKGNKMLYSASNKSFMTDKNGEVAHIACVEDITNDLYYIRAKVDNESQLDYYDINRYIFYIFYKPTNSLLLNPRTNDIKFYLGYNLYMDLRRWRGPADDYVIEYLDNGVSRSIPPKTLIKNDKYINVFTQSNAFPSVIEKNTDDNALTNAVNENLNVTYDEIKMMVVEAINKIIF